MSEVAVISDGWKTRVAKDFINEWPCDIGTTNVSPAPNRDGVYMLLSLLFKLQD
jgi:hypothetical protein